MKEDKSLEQYRILPKFIEELNQNIKNIDDKINNKGNKVNQQKENKNNVFRECADIKNLVKQSVEGLSEILNDKISKNPPSLNIHSSCKNLNGNGYEVIQEEIPERLNTRLKERHMTPLNVDNKKKITNRNSTNTVAVPNNPNSNNTSNSNNNSGNVVIENSSKLKKKETKPLTTPTARNNNTKQKLIENSLSIKSDNVFDATPPVNKISPNKSKIII
jgi:hypothetical protein